MSAIKFRGVDFIEFDTLLTDDERLVRDTARKFIEDNLIPIIEECNRAGRFPRELVKPMARPRVLWRQSQGLWLRRHVERGIRPGDAGTGARRLGRAVIRQRAIGARDVSDLRLRQRRAKKHLAARPCRRARSSAASA